MWHVPAAHSDGDLIVFFRKSDVIVAGDVIAADRYPYIDAKNGGSIQGIIDGLNRIVATAVPEYNQQGGTRVIPGHGRIMNQSDVVEYRDMATIIRDRIAQLAKEGKTLEQVKAMHPTLDYDGIYGSTTGPWTTDMFIDEVYKEVTAKPAARAGAGRKEACREAVGELRSTKSATDRDRPAGLHDSHVELISQESPASHVSVDAAVAVWRCPACRRPNATELVRGLED